MLDNSNVLWTTIVEPLIHYGVLIYSRYSPNFCVQYD